MSTGTFYAIISSNSLSICYLPSYQASIENESENLKPHNNDLCIQENECPVIDVHSDWMLNDL